MKAYRYNSENRSDRRYNNCGKEKNPQNVLFLAKKIEYAEKYQYIYDEAGTITQECTLEVVEVADDAKLFNMCADFQQLSTFNNYIAIEIGTQMRDYTRFMNEAKNKKERKMWVTAISNLKKREDELISTLKADEFQQLSDFSRQNELVAELKAAGFDGYVTKNEIAIFTF
jgi:uncharacterized protein YwgA